MSETAFILNAFMAIVMLWIVRKYLNIFLQKKSWSISIGIVWILYFVYQVYAESGATGGSIWPIAANVVLIFLISVICYEGSIINKFFFTVLHCVIGALIEMATYFMLLIMVKRQIPEFYSLGSVISKLLFIIIIMILNMTMGNFSSSSMPIRYFLLLLFVPVGSALIANNIFVLDHISGSNHSALSFSMLLLMNCFIFEVNQKLYQTMELKKDNAIYMQQFELLTQDSMEKQNAWKEQQEFRHNLRNYLEGLKSRAGR